MRQQNQLQLRFTGEYKPIKGSSGGKADEYDVLALAKRLNISLEDMKQMSYVSLMNILISSVEKNDEKEATEEDIRKMFG